MTPHRILYVNGGVMHRGGIESYMMAYYRNIDRNILQIDFIVHGFEKGVYDDEIEALGGKIYKVPVKSKDYIGNIRGLKKIFMSYDYKIIHSHLDAMSSVVLKVAKDCGIPIRIAHSHNTKHLTENKVKFMVNEYARLTITKYATHLFSCSDPAARWLFGSHNVESGAVVFIKNAIDLDKFIFDETIRTKYREELGIGDELVIGHVGRFDYQKNHLYLIDIFTNLLKFKPDAKLILVGDGQLKSRILDKISEKNIVESLVLLGVRDDVDKLLNVFDYFLLPSHFEGLGIVLVEAQVNGLRCITSTATPIEVNINGQVEFLPIDKKSIDSWVQQILKTDVSKRSIDLNEFSVAGYGIKNEAKKLQDLYLQYIGDLR